VSWNCVWRSLRAGEVDDDVVDDGWAGVGLVRVDPGYEVVVEREGGQKVGMLD